MSNPVAPFYLGATIESLDVESTDQGWQVQPRPLSGPISHGRGGSGGGPGGGGDSSAGRQRGREKNDGETEGGAGTAAFGAASSGDGDGGGGGGDGPDGAPGARVGGAGGGVGDRLVKKGLRLNQLAVYWNPAEDGNPCSMHLSDIPVEQAEVVISRYMRPPWGSSVGFVFLKHRGPFCAARVGDFGHFVSVVEARVRAIHTAAVCVMGAPHGPLPPSSTRCPC